MARGISVHIGLNRVDADHYAGWSGPLNACEADAEAMRALAAARGFEPLVLLTEQATRPAVTEVIEDAAARLGPGDMFLLTYAGHGGQVPDTSGDEEDGFDETWCLYDGQLLDDELYALWSRFKRGTRILVVSDSCHSGTATRAPQLVAREAITRGPTAEQLGITEAAYRYLPRREALRTYRLHRAFYNEVQQQVANQADQAATVRLLSGCQDNQYSLDGDENGLFTGTLLAVWDGGRFAGNYREFHQQILELMPATQSPNHTVVGPPNPQFDAETPFAP